MKTVDWTAHSACMRRLPRHLRPFYTKFLHRWLPVGSRLAQMHQDDDTCPSCRTAAETHHHFITCNHCSRTQWITETISGLRTLLADTATNPNLKELIIQGLDATLHGHDQPELNESISPILQRLARNQQRIGWDQWLNCRVHHDWICHQDRYLKHTSQYNARSCTGKLWIQRIFHYIIRRLHTLWTLRCNDLHGLSEVRASKAIRRRTENEVRALYSMSDRLPAAYQRAFDTPLETRLQASTTHLEAYLAIHKPVISRGLKLGHAAILQCHKPITSYFPPKDQPPPEPPA